ncbi:hypothetical protein Lesp02_73440 [Lentzea sp. NBRC 105346]|uniref:hypothetical protein n=1 Tax=Lentzea sp. NBRC 105346 TaxID=3032205 RepID=UPI00249FC628|nr:hypothetical protein [Lentzea sp. NBRC 105346]GLZ35157.1 hypothetical protein Lesp02_73440 [Lentzea sp. NBRC 105346]
MWRAVFVVLLLGFASCTPAETLHGVVREGVESCLAMEVDGQTYTLFVNDRAVVRPGAEVVVTGYRPANAGSGCMFGEMFIVTWARRV